MRSHGSPDRDAVKCPKCASLIPLSSATTELPIRSDSSPDAAQAQSDAQLRRMLKNAKHKRSNGLADSTSEADVTQPDLPAAPEDTAPDQGMRTLPLGRNAMKAEALASARPTPPRPSVEPSLPRKRIETPRAAAIVPTLRPPQAPVDIERPVVDEPTYTGPMPGRTPQITPSGSDLSRFLEPGNYLVRVEDVVYDSVTEKELARLLNDGIFFAIDELRPESGDWVTISSPELFADLKARLAHRAHHALARVTPGKPAADYGRPAEPGEQEVVMAEPSPEVRADAVAQAAPGRPSRVPLVIAAVVTAAAVTGAATLIFVPQANDWANSLVTADPVAPDAENDTSAQLSVLTYEDAGEIDPVPAYQSALATVHGAHALADSIDGMLAVASEEQQDARAATFLAFEKWKRRPSTVESAPLIKQLMRQEDWQAVRQVANWAVVAHGDSPELREVIHTSLERQFALENVIEVTREQFPKFVGVDPGHRPALILQDVQGRRWTMWPDLGHDEWRNDIATYRLCQVMVCHFRIPETREMSIDRETFRALIDASPENAQEMATKLKPDFDWDADGNLHGSIRLLPEGAPWPIELSQIWRPWLTTGTGVKDLEDDVEPAHAKHAFFGAAQVYPEIHGIRARQLARQVSSMLLVDYLVNNWNRFAPNEEEWGSRTRIDDGLVYSVEESAAFLGDSFVRTEGRFSWARRFSRATVESLRQLDEKVVGSFLFPNPTADDKKKLDILWSQRSRAMRRITKLVKEYGAEDVYALDAPLEGTDK